MPRFPGSAPATSRYYRAGASRRNAPRPKTCLQQSIPFPSARGERPSLVQLTAKAPATNEDREFVDEPDERIHLSFLCGAHDPLNRRNRLFELRHFNSQLLAPRCRESVETGSAVGLRYLPLGFHPTLQ